MKNITFKNLLKFQKTLSKELVLYFSKKFGFEIKELDLQSFICNEECCSDCDGDDNHYIVKVKFKVDINDLEKILEKKDEVDLRYA